MKTRWTWTWKQDEVENEYDHDDDDDDGGGDGDDAGVIMCYKNVACNVDVADDRGDDLDGNLETSIFCETSEIAQWRRKMSIKIGLWVL